MRALTPSERLSIFAAAKRVHTRTTCVLVIENAAGEMRLPRTPAEMHSANARCVVCGRRAQPDDRIGWRTPGRSS